jgi:bifunctional enzyme CysN/CysC
MPWYLGPTLMGHLETVQIDDHRQLAPFRLPVQWVNRPNQTFRGFAGTIASGTVHPGDRLRVLPSGKESRVKQIVGTGFLACPYSQGQAGKPVPTMFDLEEAVADQSVTIVLEDEIDASRGNVLAKADALPAVADQFKVTIIWMAEEAMFPGRQYWVKVGTKLALGTVTDLKHKVNVNTLEKLAAKTLELNEIGECNLSLDQPIAFDPYAENHETGGFILIDRLTNGTVGAGLIHFALRRAENIHWQAIEINKEAHAASKNQKACILWFTGLSGSGKSTIANLVEKRLYSLGHHTFLLDGDNVRHGLNRDLGFTNEDRVENIRRVGEVSKLMIEAGLIVLVSFISPFRAERRMARALVEAGEFIEVFVDTPLAVAEARDPKGLYKKARAGEIKHFTGIDSEYERPENPEIAIDTTQESSEAAADRIVRYLAEMGSVREVGSDFSI